MDRKEAVILIKDYIYYINQCSNGFSSMSTLGRLIKGEVTDNLDFKSTVPKIHFTDAEVIARMNRVELALEKLKAGYPKLFLYICERYAKRKKLKEIQNELSISESSSVRLHNEAIDTLRYFLG